MIRRGPALSLARLVAGPIRPVIDARRWLGDDAPTMTIASGLKRKPVAPKRARASARDEATVR
jgi:hypothetical protein